MSVQLVEIDGSKYEGGGQTLRISLALSAIIGTPIRITNIRAGRSSPGLKEQHLKGLELAAALCKANIVGANIGSTTVEFWPNKIESGYYTANVKTAGSISLLLQVALPICLFANGQTKLTLRGGTNVPMAPQIDYMTEVFRPILELFGATFDLDLIRRGYFPRGGGEVKISIESVPNLNGVDLCDRGEIVDIYGYSFAAGRVPNNVANQLTKGAEWKITNDLPFSQIETYKERQDVAPDNCSGILLIARTNRDITLATSTLGNKNINPFKQGQDVAQQLLTTLREGSSLDEYAQDQVIILMTLAKGKSKVKLKNLTNHTQTAIYVVELLTKVKFKIEQVQNMYIVECEGIGEDLMNKT